MPELNRLVLNGAADAPILAFTRKRSVEAEDLDKLFSTLSNGGSDRVQSTIQADHDGQMWSVVLGIGQACCIIDAQARTVTLYLDRVKWAECLDVLRAFDYEPNTYVWLNEDTELSLLLSYDGGW